MSSRLPTYFISHGGGPWPYMADWRPRYAILEKSLLDIPRQIGDRPRAVLMISAHWEEEEVSIMTGARPPMLYDYYGFPASTYSIQYPAPGAPELVGEVEGLLRAASIPFRLEPTRGFDHGTFTPMTVMYPAADVPILQVSLKAGLDPAQHLALGRALAPLRDQGVLIIGSGLSYHNLRLFGPTAKAPSKAFDEWLTQTVVHSDAQARSSGLIHWEDAPSARVAHPREEHLLPLMVAVGAAYEDKAHIIYHEEAMMGGVTASSYRFGDAIHS